VWKKPFIEPSVATQCVARLGDPTPPVPPAQVTPSASQYITRSATTGTLLALVTVKPNPPKPPGAWNVARENAGIHCSEADCTPDSL